MKYLTVRKYFQKKRRCKGFCALKKVVEFEGSDQKTPRPIKELEAEVAKDMIENFRQFEHEGVNAR